MLRRLLPAFAWLATFAVAPAADIAFPLATNKGQPIQLPAAQPDAKGNYPKPPEATWPDEKKGETIRLTVRDSKIYPGIENDITIYVPSSYTGDKPSCIYVALDNVGPTVPAIYENLIAKKEVPMTILVGVAPGTVWKDKAAKQPYRFNRSYEFDSMNGNFADYLEKEILPLVESQKTSDGRPIRISHAAADRAIGGASTGGIGSFTVAWQRPDLFSRVFSMIGTFVSMRGGHEYPALIRKTEPKPIRVFLEDGSEDAWNPLFGSWFTANLDMDAALTFAGYDAAHLWGIHGHDHKLADAVLPDIMRWLWRGWPEPVKAGVSKNDMLTSILVPGEGWQVAVDNLTDAHAMAANPKGEIAYFNAEKTHLLGADGKSQPGLGNFPRVTSMAFGPDGTLYVTDGQLIITRLVAPDSVKVITTHLPTRALAVTNANEIFIAGPGEYRDGPGSIGFIKPDWLPTKGKAPDGGGKNPAAAIANVHEVLVGTGDNLISGIAITPDKQLLLTSEANSKWITTYVIQPDGTLAYKQRYFWLHMTDLEGNSGAGEMAFDTRGFLYVATRMGVQVCDRQGRVRAILTLPTPFGAVTSLCFGGPNFDTLYVTDGKKICKRKMAVPGFPPWAQPITLSPTGAG